MTTVPRHPQYHSSLVSLMSFVDGIDYSKDHEFTVIELSMLTPTNIKNWLEIKVYGMVNPGLNNQPTKGRSGTLYYS